MKQAMRFGASAAILMLCAQPCLAAEDLRERADGERHSAAFAGATIRLPFGSATEQRPTARLQFTIRHVQESRSAAPTVFTQPAGFEFGATGAGTPSLYIGALTLRQIRERVTAAQDEETQSDSDRNLSAAMVFGGLVIAGIIGAIALSGQTNPEDVTTSPPRD